MSVSTISPLQDREYMLLGWSSGYIIYPNTIRITTSHDGSSLFVSIAKAFFDTYNIGLISGIALDKKKFIKDMRKDLAQKLTQPINYNNPTSDTYYMLLYALEPKLEEMQERLNSDLPIPNEHIYKYIEYMSNVFNKDIYILDYISHDVVLLGDVNNLYKGRPSIVLLYVRPYYELIGIINSTRSYIEGPTLIQTVFDTNHPFILMVRDRLNQQT